MKQLTIDRSNFDVTVDSIGDDFFNLILKRLGLPEKSWKDIEEIDLLIQDVIYR